MDFYLFVDNVPIFFRLLDVNHIFVYRSARMLQVSDLKPLVHIVHMTHKIAPPVFCFQAFSFPLWVMWTT